MALDDYDEIENSDSESEYENVIEHKKKANVSKPKQNDPKIDYVRANI